MIVDEREVNLVAFVPCPIEAEMSRQLQLRADEHAAKTGRRLVFTVPSTPEEKEKYDRFSTIVGLDALPDAVVSMGFGDFMRENVLRGLARPDNFARVAVGEPNGDFRGMALGDPEDCFTLISTFPSVFLVDERRLGSSPPPRRWSDLIDGEYGGRIAVSGSKDVANDAVLLTMYKNFGEEGLRRLSRNVRAVGSYSKIVAESAGEVSPPAIFAIPYHFALKERGKEGMTINPPARGRRRPRSRVHAREERRQGKSERIRRVLHRSRVRRVSAGSGFPVPSSGVENKLPVGATFNWIGWDFIRKNDTHALKRRLSELFLRERPQ